MPKVPCQKGTSVLPLIAALKQQPNHRELVSKELHKYFDGHMVVSGWYPERDYFVLVDALAKALARQVGGDPWRIMARFSAKVDIGGIETKDGTDTARGVYKTYASGDASDPALFFRRAVKLWSQYHDSGTMEIRGGQTSTNSVVLRLSSFHIPLEGFVRLQGYYLEEFGKLIGLPLESRVLRSTATGGPYCEWELVLEPSERAHAYIASLPQLTASLDLPDT